MLDSDVQVVSSWLTVYITIVFHIFDYNYMISGESSLNVCSDVEVSWTNSLYNRILLTGPN